MPTIDVIDGIKINIYNGDHPPPHIHAVYGEYEALLTIEKGELLEGNLPDRKLKKVLNWLANNSKWAQTVYNELNPTLR
jgi:hypothetical protein